MNGDCGGLTCAWLAAIVADAFAEGPFDSAPTGRPLAEEPGRERILIGPRTVVFAAAEDASERVTSCEATLLFLSVSNPAPSCCLTACD